MRDTAIDPRRQLKVVNMPAMKNPVRESPGFAKKQLVSPDGAHLDLLKLCEYGCRYCSTNDGNTLRIPREALADETEAQLGERLYPKTSPELTFFWPDIIERLEEQIATKPATWGEGETMVISQLTDPLSPRLFKTGIPMRALKLLVARTKWRFRLLTKSPIVGSPAMLRFLADHADRFIVGVSIGTLDDAWAERIEVNTSPPSARVKAHRAVQAAGIPNYVMLCPIFPHMLDRDGVERLLDATQPDLAETVWFEPYNDRLNAGIVAAEAEAVAPAEADWMRNAFGPARDRALWSTYATDLYKRVLEAAKRGRYVDKLRYLLYEEDITAGDARYLSHTAPWNTMLLQSAKNKRSPKNPTGDDLTRHPGFREWERAAMARWAETQPGQLAHAALT